jgi:hypothetical protein
MSHNLSWVAAPFANAQSWLLGVPLLSGDISCAIAALPLNNARELCKRDAGGGCGGLSHMRGDLT